MTNQDRREFIAYLEGCTLGQLYGVLQKEKAARRHDYVALTENAIQQQEQS